MNTEKLHRFLILLSFLICVFIYLDCTLIPSDKRTEKVEKKNKYRQQTKRNSRKTYAYEIETNKSKQDVTGLLYDQISEQDTIKIYYSIISHVIQRVEINNEEKKITYENNYLNVNNGYVFLCILTVVTLFCQFAYNKLPYDESKKRIALFVFIATLITLFFYLWL